jgi:hypothetical protein
MERWKIILMFLAIASIFIIVGIIDDPSYYYVK